MLRSGQQSIGVCVAEMGFYCMVTTAAVTISESATFHCAYNRNLSSNKCIGYRNFHQNNFSGASSNPSKLKDAEKVYPLKSKLGL
jgi:hypothetical protein